MHKLTYRDLRFQRMGAMLDGFAAQIITGTGPTLAAMTEGDTLGPAVVWGSYASSAGTISVTREMNIGAGWVAYVAGATPLATTSVQVRERVTDSVATPERVFVSGVQVVAAIPVAPSLTGGAITQSGADLIITPPTASGSPNPTVTLVSVFKDDVDITSSLMGMVVLDFATGVYTVTYGATNGVLPNAELTFTDGFTKSFVEVSGNTRRVAIIGQSEPAVGMMITSSGSTSLYTKQAYPPMLAGVDAAITSRQTNISSNATAPASFTLSPASIAAKLVSPGFVGFANLWHVGSGGAPLRVCDVTKPGTGATALTDSVDVDGPETGDRAYSVDAATIAKFTADFGQVESALVCWWNAEAASAKTLIASRSAVYVGLLLNGLPDMTNTVERPIIDLSGRGRGLLPETAKFSILLPGARINGTSTDYQSTPNSNYEYDKDGVVYEGMVKQNSSPANSQRQAFIDFLPLANRGKTGITPALVRFGDYVEGVKDSGGQSAIHPSVLHKHGQILFSQDIAAQELVAAGYTTAPYIDRWTFASDGAKATAHIRIPTNGVLTTLRKREGGIVATPRPHQHLDGMGFLIARSGDTAKTRRPIFRTDCTDAAIHPVNYRGAVTIAHTGMDVGGGVWEARVDITPVTPFADGDKVMLDTSGAYGGFILHGYSDYDAQLYQDGLRVYLASLDDGTAWAYPGLPVPNQAVSQPCGTVDPEPTGWDVIGGVNKITINSMPEVTAPTVVGGENKITVTG